MRKFKLFLVFVLGLVLVLPYWGGREAEKAFMDKAAALSKSDDWQIDVQVVSYERGWYRSTAQTRLMVRGAKPGDALLLNHDIVHGPVPLGDVTHGRLPLRLALAVVYSHDAPSSENASQEHRSLIALRTEIGLRKDIALEYEILPYQDAKQGFEWGGLHGSASIPTIGRQTVQFESPGLRATRRGVSLDIGSVGGEFEMEPSDSGILLGQGTVTAAHVLFEQQRKGRPARQLDIRDVSWTHEVTESIPGETLNLSTGLSFGTVRGWTSRIQGGEWHVVCQELDYQALRSLESASRTAAGRQNRLAPQFVQALAKIISRSPRFETRLKLTTTDGVIEGTGDMSLASSLAALKAGAPPHRLPSEWLITIFFSPAVLDPAKLDPIWQANILTVDGERYRLTARYRQGLVDLNGAILSLKDFGVRLLLLVSALRL